MAKEGGSGNDDSISRRAGGSQGQGTRTAQMLTCVSVYRKGVPKAAVEM